MNFWGINLIIAGVVTLLPSYFGVRLKFIDDFGGPKSLSVMLVAAGTFFLVLGLLKNRSAGTAKMFDLVSERLRASLGYALLSLPVLYIVASQSSVVERTLAKTAISASCMVNNKLCVRHFENTKMKDREIATYAGRRACAKGSAEVCSAMGEGYFNVNLFDKSSDYFARACELNDQAACVKDLLVRAMQNDANAPSAVHELRKKCELVSDPHCRGLLNFARTVGDQQLVIAALYPPCFKRNSVHACRELGAEYRLAGNQRFAIGAFSRACSLSDLASCHAVAIGPRAVAIATKSQMRPPVQAVSGARRALQSR